MNSDETLGRYTRLCESAQKKINERNALLARFGNFVNGFAQKPLVGQRAIGRRCNFEAIARLTAEAQQLEDELLLLLDEIQQLAPLADRPPLALS